MECFSLEGKKKNYKHTYIWNLYPVDEFFVTRGYHDLTVGLWVICSAWFKLDKTIVTQRPTQL